MAKITDIVNRSFEDVRDFKIEYGIKEKGAASLLTGVYSRKEADSRKFYKKPALAESDEVKLAILYGEVMITPYIIDMGSSTGTQDPEAIKKTIRFIVGEGQTEGVPVGPNGSQLENVYIDDGKDYPDPVITSDGRPTTKDVIIASALGGVMSSIPSIWDAIVGDVDDANIVTDTDPVTGGKIQSVNEQQLAATTLTLEGLADVNAGAKNDGYVLAYDNKEQKWVPTPIGELIGDVQSEGVSGGAGGDGGDGGAGGTGGMVTDDPVKYPDTSLQKPDCSVKSSTQSGMVEMLSSSQQVDNEYKEVLDIVNTNGIELHFYFDGLGTNMTWNADNATDPTSDFPCLTNPNPSNSAKSVSALVDGMVTLSVCLSTDICGTEYAIYKENYSVSGASETAFSQHTQIIYWHDTELSKLWAYIHQIYPHGKGQITLRIRRVDGDANCPKSNYPVFYQGLRYEVGDELTKPFPPAEVQYPYLERNQSMEDDGKIPDKKPLGSTLGPDTCPTRSISTPGTPPEPGEPGQPGQPGTSGEVTIEDKSPTPKITPNSPVNVTYCKAEGATNFTPTNLGTINSVMSNSTTPSPVVTMTYSMVSGEATFTTSGTPSGVTISGQNTRTLTLQGDDTAMPAASGYVQIVPDPSAVGELGYKISVTNDMGGITGIQASALSCEQSVGVSKGACAFVTLEGSTSTTGTTAIWAEVPNTTTTEPTVMKQLTSAPVNKTNGQTIEAHAQAVANNINANVSTKISLRAGVEAWLPAYTATAEGAKVTVCCPDNSGAAFNSLTLDPRFTGGMGANMFDSLLNFLGGVTKNISDFVTENPFWNAVGDVLLGVGGNVLGAVVTNILMNNNSSLEITIPNDDDVTVTFLYRGRQVNVPEEYNGHDRVNSPNYDDWSGVWKLQWTDNPAWCLLDYIENRKFGLGDDIIMTAAQKELLLRDIFLISQYCDERTDDGTPRFSLNTAITDGTKIQILEQLCSVFFGSFCLHKGGLRILADRPDANIRLLVNQANADDFVYEHTTLRSFYNKVEVVYVEPSSFFTQESVKVENTLGIQKYGEKAMSVVGFGITNYKQALRYANWLIQTEVQNSLLVTYKGGWDHYRLVPGDIVQFEDSGDRGIRLAGRIKSLTGVTVVTDGAVNVVVGQKFSVTMQNGVIHVAEVTSVANSSQFTITQAPTITVLPYSTFILTDISTGPQLYRVLKIDETSDGNYNTTLQIYNIDKYNKIISSTRALK
jgi:hypothetical protein